ncbi:transcriptional regulator, GntR family [Paraglaciecola sp. T6c]|uniref:GntR family transcriptional regulator n=1 Tax=Pseudoalteromonas atlantica (strain T6c / ATCC BAA-1087) TaxID=3042615 RepID=UPI00005C5EE3|nr:GntR family transcriptional regulator [Paraglaciecola sp. T6c]ABG41205.1 transcriptional regulator, GntR family [Paraglaciecola sp. T6c]
MNKNSLSPKHVLTSPLLTDQAGVYANILSDIINAVFVSGERLVTTQLAQRYSTSINPVREALKQLQGEGFVNVAPNSGASVSTFTASDTRDVFEVLQLLDPYLMEWFVEEHIDEQRHELENVLFEMEKLTSLAEPPHGVFRHLDTQFHWLMYKDHYNKNAVEIWRRNRLILHVAHGSLTLSSRRIEQSIAEHKALLQALEEREVAKTLKTLKAHIASSGRYWSRYQVR